MDRFIKTFDAVEDRDLMLCHARGTAWQREVKALVPYDAAYFDKYVGYEGKGVALAINAGRVSIVNQHAGPAMRVADIGIGSGEFIKSRPHTFGRDVNETAIEWLRERRSWAVDLATFRAFTFWDVIEHVSDPDIYFRHVPPGGFLFTSLPIFGDLRRIRESRHYRPNEHLYYWTAPGFVSWMALHGFVLLDQQDFEIQAGRDSILSFAFKRCS